MIIDKLETYHNGSRALNMVEIYVDGKLIKKEPNWRDKMEEQILMERLKKYGTQKILKEVQLLIKQSK